MAQNSSGKAYRPHNNTRVDTTGGTSQTSPKSSIDGLRYQYSNYSMNEYYHSVSPSKSVQSGYTDRYEDSHIFDPDGYSVDGYGRVLNNFSIDDTNEPEDIGVFISKWTIPRLAALKDGEFASKCIWPDIPHTVHLKRFDLFQSDRLLLQQGTSDVNESRRIRSTGQWIPILNLFCLDVPTSITKPLLIMTSTLPKRDKFILADKSNTRDTSKWVPKGKLDVFIGQDRIPGSCTYYIDFQDSPDRYAISKNSDPQLGYRRLFSFAAYGASQYYLLQKSICHESLETEGGVGMTFMLERGVSVVPRKNWKLIGSFYGFDHPLPGSNCFQVYTRQDPFPRMQISMSGTVESGWNLTYQFYTFDIPVPDTATFQIHHTVKSIYTGAACITRHKISLDEAIIPPWEFRTVFYAFPAAIDDCTFTGFRQSADE